MKKGDITSISRYLGSRVTVPLAAPSANDSELERIDVRDRGKLGKVF